MAASIPLSALQSASGGTALDVISGGGAAGLGSMGALAMANPYLAAAKFVIDMFSGSSIKVSKASAGGLSQSGAEFTNDDVVSLSKPLLDLSNPLSVAIAAALIVGGIYAYKKYMR